MIRFALPWDNWHFLLTPRFAAAGMPWQYIVIGLLLVVPAVLLIWLYLYEQCLTQPIAAILLFGLRFFVIAAIWFVVAWQPVIARTEVEDLPSRVVILVDRSKSMEITDPQRSVEEKAQLARSLKLPLKSDQVDKLTRSDIVRAILGKRGLQGIKRLQRKHRTDVIGFHKQSWQMKPSEIEKTNEDDPKPNATPTTGLFGSHFTNIGRPFEKFLTDYGKYQGKTIAVVLFSDGRHNWGETPIAATEKMALRKIPVYPVVIGGSKPPPDVAITEVDAPANILEGADAVIKARIRVSGLAAQKLVVELLQNGKPAQNDQIRTIDHDGSDKTYVASFQLPMKSLGTQELQVKVSAAAKTAEISHKNNTRSFLVRVTKEKARVLIVEGEARWEYHYLEKALSRDKSIKPVSVVFSQPRLGKIAEKELTKANHPRLTLPGWDEKDNNPDPLNVYACIVVGDVAPDQLLPRDRRRLEQYVSNTGGTLVFVAGKRWMPLAFADKNADNEQTDPLAKLLPLTELREIRPINGFRVALTSDGNSKPYLQMESTPEKSLARWRKLPKHYWAVIGNAKPGATTLAFVPDDAANDENKKVSPAELQRQRSMLLVQNYGFGRVVYVGLDSTWRWRFRTGDLYHHRFWGQLMRWAAADKLLPAGNDFVRYGSKKPAYKHDEDIVVQARLLASVANLPAGSDAKARILRLNDDGQETAAVVIALTSAAQQPRLWQGSAKDLPAGRYRIKLDIPALKEIINGNGDKPQDNESRRDEFVVLPSESSELQNLATNLPLLQTLARKTGGEVFDVANVESLFQRLNSQAVRRDLSNEHRIWENIPEVWYLLIGILTLLTLEWITRKLVGLP